MNNRGEFSSRFGFILAAAGSAIGLGNIWGFPTQVASNGGAAFVLVYLLLAFVLAYPVLMAELIVGRAMRANIVTALGNIAPFGKIVGVWGTITAGLILSFYAIVAGWMIAYFLEIVSTLVGWSSVASWMIEFSVSRNLVFSGAFIAMTALIVSGGVSKGIEKWSVRLMPTLLMIIVGLIIYVSFQPGAMQGWKAYLLPDFSRVLKPDLLISAMGQAFFSMSLGVGTMLIYGSYISRNENLPVLGASVALMDIAVAILAGMLIIPAMYVALNQGVEIFDAQGALIAGDKLIFTVLPQLFDSMGQIGIVVALAFFCLMVIAALTSSISMLEVPVAYLVENKNQPRSRAVWLVAVSIFLFSSLISFNFDDLFGFIVSLSTKYSQPLVGIIICVFVGWLWRRDAILRELATNDANIEQSVFWKIWPWYIKFVCPVIVGFMFVRSIL